MVDLWLFAAGLWALAIIVEQYDGSLKQLADRIDQPDPEPTPIDEVHQDYYEDRIDETELERRLEILVDDRAKTIRDMVDETDGIGAELSRDLAREFETVADLQAADVEDLRAVDGIGETTANRLREKLS